MVSQRTYKVYRCMQVMSGATFENGLNFAFDKIETGTVISPVCATLDTVRHTSRHVEKSKNLSGFWPCPTSRLLQHIAVS